MQRFDSTQKDHLLSQTLMVAYTWTVQWMLEVNWTIQWMLEANWLLAKKVEWVGSLILRQILRTELISISHKHIRI